MYWLPMNVNNAKICLTKNNFTFWIHVNFFVILHFDCSRYYVFCKLRGRWFPFFFNHVIIVEPYQLTFSNSLIMEVFCFWKSVTSLSSLLITWTSCVRSSSFSSSSLICLLNPSTIFSFSFLCSFFTSLICCCIFSIYNNTDITDVYDKS